MTIDRRTVLAGAGLGAVGVAFLAGGLGGTATAAFPVQKTPAQWKAQLGPQRYAILREASTERPYSSALNKEHRKGVFACAGCALPLYSSTTKFDSGTGWPSFYRALPNAIVTKSDFTLGMKRTEVLCKRCGGHLGHVFDDGPPPTGLRYCMNGLAMTFKPGAA
ncbi:peptide-methionine (R)-S-oxide reductase MsrB [Sphingomonas rosea]|uniref:peptide-methionine (R)-S-oxide reductase n=1 Tax=Sphingomonas rosea TaxID=335605 RepID=A0ABP7U3B3_9SPHN